ncbi:hypothetical protein M8998_04795 [Sphingobacterium sp. lm-10]|uniref:hypothetical protein n=1 Tax=Sphingobacterium sp. lm-10 TaxID=2944904 RepID=UPI002020ECB3|nr:hypothetical protein [Sphingobacterium sp. lm-10]MCL7987256.1 hypothetical protein [Sphingobacterium sp. lm-10]
MKTYLLLLTAYLLMFSDSAANTASNCIYLSEDSVTVVHDEFFDKTRNRQIPLAYYIDEQKKPVKFQKIAIISHGYGQNQGGDYLQYSYLANSLAQEGYFVISIQHELPSDELLSMEGKFLETRMPNWKRGMENIHFVLSTLKEQHTNLEFNDVTLIGHSNGGDMSVLFAHEYPLLIHKVISLDNRRMPLPRVTSPKIYSIRSNDYPADDGVLPSEEEAANLGMTIQFVDINHSNMDDDATAEERAMILSYIQQYLKD